MMKILTARFGFCLGITRAYRAMDAHAAAGTIHVAHQNSAGEFDTLRRIERRDRGLLDRFPNLGNVEVAYDTDRLSAGDRLVLGFHGLPEAKKTELVSRGVQLADDMICPFIAKLDRKVEQLAREGFDIAIVGHADNHHCRTARAIADENGRDCHVIETTGDVKKIPTASERPLALLGQVTGNTVLFAEVVESVKRLERPVKVVKTMCSDSHGRQKHAIELAREADLILLFDDGGGAAQSVYEVCTQLGAKVRRFRKAEEIKAHWLANVSTIAIIGGILIPDWSIEAVVDHVRRGGSNND